MSAVELRKAAETLRARAEGATPSGGWVRNYFYPDSGSLHLRQSPHIFSVVGGSEQDRDYIATMHPGVGLALAAWLDDESRAVAAYHANKANPFALDLARLINRGAA